MDTVRYIIASLVVVSLPPAIVFWFVVHPFAAFWRGVGPWVTYGVNIGILVGSIVVLWAFRDVLVGTDMGFRQWMLAPSIGLYVASMGLEVSCRKYLKFKILAGLPEVAPQLMTSKLLDQGIYGRVRHPRYLAIALGTLGWALFSGYTGAVAVALGTIPALVLVTVIEERELLERFGDEYAEYRKRVPRLIPRLGRSPT
jgi:protein-S-isoprenylcysteine O-methyltransferase Ste14